MDKVQAQLQELLAGTNNKAAAKIYANAIKLVKEGK